jgi:cytochrome c heme-lyase
LDALWLKNLSLMYFALIQTWIYPSPQRFYNALKKKGFFFSDSLLSLSPLLSPLSGWRTEEESVSSVVSIHNAVNEECWRRILQYEKFHARWGVRNELIGVW